MRFIFFDQSGFFLLSLSVLPLDMFLFRSLNHPLACLLCFHTVVHLSSLGFRLISCKSTVRFVQST
uniref:Uncharacterized protein n=1 Tax=Anguilla anguilla TaxID=7936 RepID=A0A0E9WS37_ANGAN